MSDVEHIPSWVPEIAPGVLADVYPVDPPPSTLPPHSDSPPELVLDRHAVTAGYSERRLPYEFASCLPAAVTSLPAPPLSSAIPGSQPPPFNPASGNGLSNSDLSKLRAGIALLRRSRPTKLQRVEEHVFKAPKRENGAKEASSFGSKKAFPLQKPSGSSSLEDWFNKLSSGASFNTTELSRPVPLGPAIVRAAGKVIEMMATRSVPTQRAAWYIRIAVLNECVRQKRPDRPPPSPRTFWTRQLCGLLKTEIDAIRARKTAMLGPMDRVAFWEYVLDLARWQADEGLLDCAQWMAKIAALLRTELMASQSFNSPGTKITMSAARRFLPEFVSSTANAKMLLEALLGGASLVVKAWRNSPGLVAKEGSQGKGVVKGGVRRGGTLKRAQFTPNLCHREITMLLSATLRVLDDSMTISAESETRMSDLERFTKRGVGIILKRNQDNDKNSAKNGNAVSALKASLESGRDKRPSVHQVMRELEMLPSHGDMGYVVKVLLKAFEKRGGLRAAVKQICEWAVEGPSSDRGESICIGAAVVTYLANSTIHSAAVPSTDRERMVNRDIHKPRSGANDFSWSPPLQRELWHFLKEYSKEQKPAALDENDQVVRLLAHLCRIEQLSLRILVRDISRLSSHGHPGSSYLIKCLSLLPDPVDQDVKDPESPTTAALDCRRPLLRKFGYIGSSRPKPDKDVSSGQFVHGATSGDMKAMKADVDDLFKTGSMNAILSKVEVVRLYNFGKEDTSKIGNVMLTISSFLLQVEGPAVVVEWLLGNMTEVVNGSGVWETCSTQRRNEVVFMMARLVEDFARYIAASGVLEDVFALLKKAWLGTWLSLTVRKRILISVVALPKLLTSHVHPGSQFWFEMASRQLRQKHDGATPPKLLPLVQASMRGQLDRKQTEDVSMEELLSATQKPKLPSPEEELSQMIALRELHDVPVSEMRTAFSDTRNPFPIDNYFARGLTANDLFGAVFIPLFVAALEEPIAEGSEEAMFSRLAGSALELISDREYDVRFQGVRPMLLVEFIALILTGSWSGHIVADETLEALVKVSWFWKIMAPRAGMGLAKRLRNRVHYYCEKVGPVEESVVSAVVFNMIIRFSGDENRDEAMVSAALGVEPFGMVDMQLSLLATHRNQGGEDEEFGSRVCEAAASVICVESARSLASAALRSCTNEESRQIVAGLVGYGAVQAMAESLGFVVKGLTVEASKNSSLHQERAEQWYQADNARRGILECIVEHLSQEVGVQVETVLFDQLETATTLLTTARDRDCMPTNLLQDGCRISDALESRLICILRSQRTPQTADVWTQRTIQIASLLSCGAPVLKKSGIAAGLSALTLCLKNLGESDAKPDDAQQQHILTASQVLDIVKGGAELREQLTKLLKPVLLWIEEPEKKVLTHILRARAGPGTRRDNVVRAYDVDGSDIDNWVLLEGYGRGADEDAAIPPIAFSRQGQVGRGELANVVQLKRTYSTFASLAV